MRQRTATGQSETSRLSRLKFGHGQLHGTQLLFNDVILNTDPISRRLIERLFNIQ